ncbi:MAG: SUF system Fe-S cluster assembly protein [Alphaproteobacteria bacterium PA3]|nr:MAG: SUF system Fe-S cluster assembly protein [Alphaproteobacteria bacterium PA3]
MSDETTAPRDMLDVSSPPIVQPDREPSDLPPEEIARKTVYDPEIPVDVYELGLIYKVDLKAGGHVDIDMTLTAPACPVAGELPIMVEDAAKTVNGINSAKAIVTFDPPWTQARMSDEARLALNML